MPPHANTKPNFHAFPPVTHTVQPGTRTAGGLAGKPGRTGPSISLRLTLPSQGCGPGRSSSRVEDLRFEAQGQVQGLSLVAQGRAQGLSLEALGQAQGLSLEAQQELSLEAQGQAQGLRLEAQGQAQGRSLQPQGEAQGRSLKPRGQAQGLSLKPQGQALGPSRPRLRMGQSKGEWVGGWVCSLPTGSQRSWGYPLLNPNSYPPTLPNPTATAYLTPTQTLNPCHSFIDNDRWYLCRWIVQARSMRPLNAAPVVSSSSSKGVQD